jgi:HNH endonuclease
MAESQSEIRDGVLRRDGYQCQRCGARVDGSASSSCHHRKLKGRGGPDTPENRVMLCGSGTTGCHGWVHANPREARLHGWLVSAYADPAELTMWSAPRREWVRLGTDYQADAA